MCWDRLIESEQGAKRTVLPLPAAETLAKTVHPLASEPLPELAGAEASR